VQRKNDKFESRMSKEFFKNSKIEVKTYNRRQRNNTYNVIGIMKGDIEPGTIILSLYRNTSYEIRLFFRSLCCNRQSSVS